MILGTAGAMRKPPSSGALLALESALSNLRLSQRNFPSPGTEARRHASHQAQGRANKAKDGAGKRLGAKKTAGEYVVTGNILYKQRGTLWFPGDNCFMGRDHTIHAGAPGYVRYYRDPVRHPKRKYIGVVFEKNDNLPHPLNAVRRRRLGMLAFQMPQTSVLEETGDLAFPADPSAEGSASLPATLVAEAPRESRNTAITKTSTSNVEAKVTLRPGYQFRQANWEIARAAERSKAAQSVQPFRPGDRFLAWRKTAQRKARNAEARALRRGGKKKK